MAEMSRLAYFKFEGGNNVQAIISQLIELLPKNTDLSSIESLITSSVPSNSKANGEKILRKILKQQDFDLVGLYNGLDVKTDKLIPTADAQAFLCKNIDQKIAILAFRGTEKKLSDIKADVSVALEETHNKNGSFLMHKGYLNQFNSIEKQINDDLNNGTLKDYQLFITGHSLGGALAITATKFLANDITGACYTFGSPPVGTKDFDRDIRTPIYRIINHVDIVPRLPSPFLVYIIRFIAFIIGWALQFIPIIGPAIKKSSYYGQFSNLLTDAQKYRQSGYGSFLVGEGNDVRVRYNVGPTDRIKWWIKQSKNSFRGDIKPLLDHSINLYSEKLAIWANNRK
ncbi:MAG: DUF2974 domain-containing protein [Methylococcales bacterium]